MTSNYFPTDFQSYIHISKYARWNEETGRRESWPETVTRYFNFMESHLSKRVGYKLTKEERTELEEAVLNLEVMPSMRALMTSGPALERDATCAYNCSALAIDDPKAFDEILFILMNGTGVGFSVERQEIAKLPIIPDELHETDTVIKVRDSKIGWAKALRELISLLYSGNIPKWDVSKVRPSGARLKTFGGFASGPEPLENLFKFVIRTFITAKGRKLTSLECHDLVCAIADIVVSGGVRRSALISLSNLSDDRMRTAKNGQWWTTNPERALANNSAVYTEKPDMSVFMTEWKSLYDSKSGERGIFSREATKKVIEHSNEIRENYFDEEATFRKTNYDFLTNPCSEIILRSKQFCNLTEVIVRPTDDEASLVRKVQIATKIGTYQSTLTHFRYLSKKWFQNTEEERLLGVSLTGILDNSLTNSQEGEEKLSKTLEYLRMQAVATNRDWSKKFNIPYSTAITCVKPSGTTSALNGTSSGIHSAHAPYYIRTVRELKISPVAQFMISQGFPYEDDVMKKDHYVFSFPMKASSDAVFRKDLSAIDHLKIWLIYQQFYCEHKPSVTISVREHEWMEVGAWVYKNFDWISGVSFLPFSDHVYKQAPFQDCTKEEYEALVDKMPKNVDWSRLTEFEKTDTTTVIQTLACSGSTGCEI